MRATPDSADHIPFSQGTALPYARTFDEQAFKRLRDGLVSRQMEDRWFIYFAEPHLFVHHSWTGKAYYRLTLAPHGDGAEVIEAQLDDAVGYRDADDHSALLGWVIGALLLEEEMAFPGFKSED